MPKKREQRKCYACNTGWYQAQRVAGTPNFLMSPQMNAN